MIGLISCRHIARGGGRPAFTDRLCATYRILALLYNRVPKSRALSPMSSPTPPQPNDTAETPAVKTYSEAFVPPPFSYAGPTWYQEPPDMGRADYQPTRPSPPHQATCCHNHSPWESPPSGIGPILPLLLTPATAHSEFLVSFQTQTIPLRYFSSRTP